MPIRATKTTVLVEDLRIDAFVGGLAPERETPQLIAVTIACTIAKPDVPDDELKNSFDYVPILEEVRRIALASKRRLIETFAEEVADICFQHPHVQTVVVSVRKPNKFPSVAAVGVERTFEQRLT